MNEVADHDLLVRCFDHQHLDVEDQVALGRHKVGFQPGDFGQVARGGVGEHLELTARRDDFDQRIAVDLTILWNQEHQFAADRVIGPAVWERRIRSMRRFLEEEGMRPWWSVWRDMYADDFCSFVDGLIREGEAAE